MENKKINYTEKDILMYFHTALRNVGLYTSVSLAMLGYSRFYRGKNKIYNLSFIIISLLFLLFSMMLCFYIIKTVNFMKHRLSEKDYVGIAHLDRIPRFVLTTNTVVFIFGLFTLYREFKK